MKTGMKRLLSITKSVTPAVLSLLLVACASTGPAPVDDLSLGSHARTTDTGGAESRNVAQSGSYRVQRGDTLYSIAFRHGVDYRELAGWNHISSPYTIYVGQELRVANAPATRTSPAVATAAAPSSHAPPAMPATAVAKAAPSVPTPAPFETVAAQSVSTSPPASENAVPATAPSAPPASSPTVPSAAVVRVETAPTPPVAAPPPVATPSASTSGEIAWRWPAAGPVVGTYVAGDQTRQGIDIAGKSGDPVRAAADGTVVYSGNGLIGYGELIIVKHSPAFLSAYGHNRRRLVKEGDHVSSGQEIAEMGSSSANRDSLHFEIRKNGKPANPTDYLPRR